MIVVIQNITASVRAEFHFGSFLLWRVHPPVNASVLLVIGELISSETRNALPLLANSVFQEEIPPVIPLASDAFCGQRSFSNFFIML